MLRAFVCVAAALPLLSVEGRQQILQSTTASSSSSDHVNKIDEAGGRFQQHFRSGVQVTGTPQPRSNNPAPQSPQQPAGNANSAQTQNTANAQQNAAGTPPAEAWWLPPATSFASATNAAYGGVPPQVAASFNAPPYPAYPGAYPSKYPYGYGYPYYGYYPSHPYAAYPGIPGAGGYRNVYSYYPGAYRFQNSEGQGSAPPRFAEKHLDEDVPLSDAHAAAAASGYDAAHWEDFAPQHHSQEPAAGFPSAYRPAQRASIMRLAEQNAKFEFVDKKAGVEAELAKLEALAAKQH